jgi:integrase
MSLKLYKRGKVWWYSGTVAGRRLRKSTGSTDKTTAKRIASETEAKAWSSHLDGPGATLMFSQAALAYRNAEKSDRFLEKVEDYWKDTVVSKITPGAVRQSAIELYPNAGAATRNRQAIVPTQAIINHAASLEWCQPIKVKRFPVETKTKEPATLEWISTFVAHSSPHLGALAMFMFGTGARIGEALALRWSDIDLIDLTAVIKQTKVNDERISNLPPQLFAAIANIPSNRNPEDRVFQYSDTANVRKVWNNTIKRAGIKQLSPHSCRHGFATTMLQAGVDVKTVADRGGWKDVATLVKTYAHAMQDPHITDVIFDTNLVQANNLRKQVIVK